MRTVTTAVALSLVTGLLLGACTAQKGEGSAGPEFEAPSLQTVPALIPPEDADVLHEQVATTGRGRLKHFIPDAGEYQLIVACVGAPLVVEANGSPVADVPCDRAQHSASVLGQPDREQSVWVMATDATAWRVLITQTRP